MMGRNGYGEAGDAMICAVPSGFGMERTSWIAA